MRDSTNINEVPFAKLKPLTLTELLNQPPRKHILKGILGAGEFSVFSGEPKCGKSFLVLDLALSIARGKDWFGKNVAQGPVIYVAAEGIGGVPKRILSYIKHHKLETEECGRQIPFHPILRTVNLLDDRDGDVNGIIHWVKKITEEVGQPVSMIVIDTLSRTMPGGNENSPEHMTQYIANCDRIREETKSHVLVIHHCPKNSSSSLRGHSSLFGAIDAHILVEKHASGGNTWTVEASKDDEDGFQKGFKLDVEVLDDVDEDGDEITSCVVEPAEVEVRTAKVKLSPTEQICLDALSAAISKSGEIPPTNNNIPPNTTCVKWSQWEVEAKAKYAGNTEDKKKAFQRGPKGLQGKGHIGVYQELVWLISGGFDD